MRPARKAYVDELHRNYHEADASQADRLNRWRSIEPESAELLALLVITRQARHLLEIGTSGAYSTLWLADAAEQTGGHLTTLEIDPVRQQTAMKHLDSTGLSAVTTSLCVDAGVFLRASQAFYDFVLLDAERPAYIDYWPHLARCLSSSGALLVVDNVLSHAGQVQDFIGLVKADVRFLSVTLPVGAGLFLAVRSLP